MKKWIFLLVLNAVLSILTQNALYAAGFQVNENSAVVQGMAMAGSAATPGEVSSIFNNPAAMGFINDTQVYVGGNFVLPHVKMRNATATHTENNGMIPIPVEGKATQSNVVKSAFVPEFYVSKSISQKMHAGLAITVPWGMTSEYDKSSVVRFMAQKTALQSLNISPMLSVSPLKTLSFAVGVQMQYLSMDLSNFDGTALNVPNAQATQATHLSMDGWGAGYLLGIMYQPASLTYLGISYHSQILTSLTGNGAQYPLPGEISPPISPGFAYNVNVLANTRLKTPGVLNFSVTQGITPVWKLAATAQETFWSSMRDMQVNTPGGYVTSTTIPYHWKNSWLLALGTSYEIMKNWTLRLGASWDQSPTLSRTRDARIPDSNRVTLALGLSYLIVNQLCVDFSYEHIFIQATSINLTQTIGDNVEQNTVSAHYQGSADLIGAGLTYHF